MTRRRLITSYWFLAGWPIAAFVALIIYSALRPPGNIPEPAATFVQWTWRLMLALSIIAFMTVPIVWRRISNPGTASRRAAVIALGISTAFQALCEFVLFQPLE